jgi:hypothetical protein
MRILAFGLLAAAVFCVSASAFETDSINGDSLDELFLDKDCPQVDARNFLSETCQNGLLAVNATLGAWATIVPPDYDMNPNVDQSILINWCQSCSSQIQQWVDAYYATKNVTCHVNAEILKSVCSIDPTSNLVCINHVGNYALPTFWDTISEIMLLGPTAGRFPEAFCDNASCCEVNAMEAVISLGTQMKNPVITGFESALRSFDFQFKQTCSSQIQTSCTSLLVQPTTASTDPQDNGATDQNNLTPASNSSNHTGLVVGVLALVGCSIGGAFYVYKRRRNGQFSFGPNKNGKWFTIDDDDDELEDGQGHEMTGPTTTK